MEYIKKLCWKDFNVLLFSKYDSLIDFLKYQPVEILLYGDDCSEDSLHEEIPKSNIKYIFHLCENQKTKQDEIQRIFKYQSAGKIVSDIISIYTKLEDNNEGKTFDDVQIISLYPPVSGAEKISFAWSLAKELSDKRKVLLVSMELLPTDFISKSDPNKYAMSEYLYFLKESCSDIVKKLKFYLSYSEKLSYLAGLTHGFDLLSLNREDAERFLKELREYKDYEIVVFYLGLYTEASMEILRRSNQIYILICDSPYEELVVKEWERQTKLAGIETGKLRYHKIRLPSAESIIGKNCLPDQIYTAIRPFGKEAADQLLNDERSSYELAEGKTSSGSP